ncbi:hypothetical protein HON52_00710 [Candidatus Uhrbacteria bacterium]|jgi:hypothetical protein|nr:hypothetical protein [Candidatus Uhrbacteria bacterium]
MIEVIKWDMYHIEPNIDSMTGVMFRGRVRKFCLELSRNILIENAQDDKGCVRFAVPAGEDPVKIIDYIKLIFPSAKVTLLESNLKNPVLSKLKVNIESRYE